MKNWSLSELLAGLHNDIENRLATARMALGHAPTKGNASEHVWLEMLQTYLPRRYKADTAHIVDSNGSFSDQIDVVVFDRQYSPFIFLRADWRSNEAQYEQRRTKNNGAGLSQDIRLVQ